nr:hypothetical protein [Methanobacterium formicicum]
MKKTKNPTIVFTEDGSFNDFNQATLDFMEAEPEELLQQKIHHFTLPEASPVQLKDWTAGRIVELPLKIKGEVKILELTITR